MMSLHYFALGFTLALLFPMTIWMICDLRNYRAGPEVMVHQDIRDVISVMIRIMASTESKLHKHEIRERIFSEHMRNSLAKLDNRLNIMDEKISKLLNKVDLEKYDSRSVINNLEAVLVKENKASDQMKPGIITSPLQGIPMVIQPKSLEKEYKSGEKTSSRIEAAQNAQKSYFKKVDALTVNMQKIQKELTELKRTKNINQQANNYVDKVHLNSDQERCDPKLAEYHPVTPQQFGNDWCANIMEALEQQKIDLEQVLIEVISVSRGVNNIPSKQELNKSQMQNLNFLQQLIEGKFKNYSKKIGGIQQNTKSSSQKMNEKIDNLRVNLTKSHQGLADERRTLVKLEQVIVQTRNDVMDTNRKVEHSVHQIARAVGNLLKAHLKEAIGKMNVRFDKLESSILDEENGALANLTSKISDEIDQVWGQIGMVHQQTTATTDTLNELQNQADVYAHGSLDATDSMKGKVVRTTDGIIEVGDNLNYLVGKLSSIAQEFNQIRRGVDKAFDKVRESLQEVQEEEENSGEGAYEIDVDDGMNVKLMSF